MRFLNPEPAQGSGVNRSRAFTDSYTGVPRFWYSESKRAFSKKGSWRKFTKFSADAGAHQPYPECALSDHLDVIAKVPTGALVTYTDGGCDGNHA
jgi:hypothetical protein